MYCTSVFHMSHKYMFLVRFDWLKTNICLNWLSLSCYINHESLHVPEQCLRNITRWFAIGVSTPYRTLHIHNQPHLQMDDCMTTPQNPWQKKCLVWLSNKRADSILQSTVHDHLHPTFPTNISKWVHCYSFLTETVCTFKQHWGKWFFLQALHFYNSLRATSQRWICATKPPCQRIQYVKLA